MSAPVPVSPLPGRPWLRVLGSVVAATVVLMALATGAWYYVEWRLAQEGAAARAATAGAVSEIDQLRRELGQRQEELTVRVARAEQAAKDAGLLVDGQALSLRLADIDRLRTEIEQERKARSEQLQELANTLRQEMGTQGEQTAAGLAADLQWRSLVIRAQGQVLKARVDLAEGNRGLTRDELGQAAQTFRELLNRTSAERKPEVQAALDALEQGRTALILEQPTVRAQLDLLWQRLGALLAS